MKRWIFLGCAIALLVSLMALPALAEPLNYRDYETSVKVDGDNDLVTVSFPVDLNRFDLYEGDYSSLAGSYSGSSCILYLSPGVSYILNVSILDCGILAENIPSGTSIDFSISTWAADGGAVSHGDFWRGIYYYRDDTGSDYWYEGYYDYDVQLMDYENFTISYPAPSAQHLYFRPGFSYEGFSAVFDGEDTLPVRISVDSITLTMSISSLYRLQEQTGETNELLDEVNKQLAEQGKTMQDVLDQQTQTNEKLDDAIYGDHGFNSSGSDFSGIGGEFSSSAGQANDAMSAGMDSLGTMMDSDAFNSTLNVLGAGIDAIFVGHEVTICGVTGNPFTLLVGVAAIAVILILAMKFIFRKWGSGGSDSSGGGSSDA